MQPAETADRTSARIAETSAAIREVSAATERPGLSRPTRADHDAAELIAMRAMHDALGYLTARDFVRLVETAENGKHLYEAFKAVDAHVRAREARAGATA